MLLNINVKNCQTHHLLSKGFFLNCAFSVGNCVTYYTFSITDNSSIIINIDYNTKMRCWASKGPKSIKQGWLIVIFYLFNTKKKKKSKM